MNARLYKILFLLAAVQFTVIVDFMVVMPLGPQLIRAFAIDTSRFSWIVSSYSLAGGISAILYNRKAGVDDCYPDKNGVHAERQQRNLAYGGGNAAKRQMVF